MGNEEKYGFELPEFPGLKTPAPLSEINPTEVTTTFKEPFEKVNKAREDYAELLRERYSKPNWFKIAAGFAKPQLGGFLASLGSANEALGEYEAQRRMVEPTIARMKAETAAAELGFGQGIKGANIQSKAFGEKRLPTAWEAGQSSSLIGGPAAAAGAAQAQFRTNYEAALRDFQAGMSIEQLRLKYPDDIITELVRRTPVPSSSEYGAPPAGGGTGIGANVPSPAPATPTSGASSKPTQSIGTGIPSAKILRDEATQSGMTPDQQLKYVEDNINEAQDARTKTRETLGQAKQYGQGLLSEVKTAWPVVTDPAIKDLFALSKGSENLANLISGITEDTWANVVTKFRKQLPVDDAVRLEKIKRAAISLNNVAAKLAQMPLQNPTDARTQLEQLISGADIQAAPQEAVARNLAKVGSDALKNYQSLEFFNSFLKKPESDARRWEASEEWRRVNDEASKRNQAFFKDPIVGKNGRIMRPAYFDMQSPNPTSLSEQIRNRRKENKG
jgi:hypothetical protein